ncbi:MAG: hypothetical protein IT379_14970 [Deltaproteobacteria bacterium]|nr:hypothetical protein [Deltaproteobacteria bacterium]
MEQVSDEDDELVSAIVEHIRAAGRVVAGSELGQLIRTRFPNSTYRQRYAGLRSLIEQRCSADVVRVGRRGFDDQYAVVGSAALFEPAATPTLWQAFTRPGSRGAPAVHGQLGKVVVVPDGNSAPVEHQIVAPLSSAEYKEMAREFLSGCAREIRDRLNPSLAGDNFWPQWSGALRLEDPATQAAWARHRTESIFKAWSDRLQHAGLEHQAASAATAALQESMRARPRSPRQEKYADRTESAQSENYDPGRTRAIVSGAISQMSDGELERLWLPLGAVLAAARRQRS